MKIHKFAKTTHVFAKNMNLSKTTLGFAKRKEHLGLL